MMGMREVHIAVGFLFFMAGYVASKDCNYQEFESCVKEVVELETGDFHIGNEDQMMEVCKAKQKAIQCSSSFVTDCMKKGERDLFEATTGGKVKVVEEMCTEGSRINRGYLNNIDCWGKVKEEIEFCNNKFNESQRALFKAHMEDRLKVFYGCCAFEWHRNCLAKVARAKCSDDAGDFVYYVSTILGGNVQNLLCSSSYSSCHGLHGVDQKEIEEKLENIPTDSKSSLNSHVFQLVTVAYFVLTFM